MVNDKDVPALLAEADELHAAARDKLDELLPRLVKLLEREDETVLFAVAVDQAEQREREGGVPAAHLAAAALLRLAKTAPAA